MFKTRYRIVRDNYLGYQVDVKKWWWPFWTQLDFSNTHSSIEKAEQFVSTFKDKVVKYID